MKVIDRPGVDPRWLKSWKAERRANLERCRVRDPEVVHELEHYALHGTLFDNPDERFADLEPPVMLWESIDFQRSTAVRGYLSLLTLEIEGMDGRPFDSQAALRAFSAIYTHQMVVLFRGNMLPIRFKKDVPQDLQLTEVPYTALGVVIGCKEQAFRLARMQIAAYQKGYYYDKGEYPIFVFMLRILADYLGEPPLVLEGEPLAEPIFNALFKLWRTEDPNALVDICLAACDYHTRRCRGYFEFYDGAWTRTPIEILLLFKLRQLLGLQNPQLDHPLMNSPLGVLPEEVAFEPDDLMKRVHARMAQNRYDEEFIYAQCYKA